jgi:formate dehydrogenase maturation protein FdhE
MTPLKKWAIFVFIEGIFLLGLAFIHVIFATNFADQTSSAIFLGLALFAFVTSLYFFVRAANINIADTIIDETFQICPLCFSSNILIDVKFGGRLTDKVLCRDCHAQWEFYLDPFLAA